MADSFFYAKFRDKICKQTDADNCIILYILTVSAQICNSCFYLLFMKALSFRLISLLYMKYGVEKYMYTKCARERFRPALHQRMLITVFCIDLESNIAS